MPLQTVTDFIGGTLRTTWINSGASASQIYSALIDRNGTLVSSASQQSSGNGHYYADLALPNSPGNYLNKQGGVIDSNTYVRWQIVKLLAPEVD